MSVVYLNGEYLNKDLATVSVDDRGFLLADGLYEVTSAYKGNFFRFEQHIQRLIRGLDFLRINYDPVDILEMHLRLLAENKLEDQEASIVYLQITRGVAPRTHCFPPEETLPTVYAFARDFKRPDSKRWGQGYAAITVPDNRWGRVDIKSIALLPNVLAQQEAIDSGAIEALLVKDGMVLEGSHSNVFGVFNGVVTTHPATHEILHGVVRGSIIELAQKMGMAVIERPIALDEMRGAEEIFFTGTTAEVRPTVYLDGCPVGDGKVGPVTKALYDKFRSVVDK
tara:strand:+ start:8788 stop:9633 length:846 start_codon:yes stop_codon:yes gene_type:complete